MMVHFIIGDAHEAGFEFSDARYKIYRDKIGHSASLIGDIDKVEGIIL